MIEVLLSAPASGSGKTMVTCALLAALKQRGLHPCAFKCGPDYIDPMFHRAALGIDSHNLDLFLSREETVKGLYARYRAGHGAVVCEGAMGFYDGVGGTTTQASAWHTADVLDLPVVLVLRPKGASLTLAAQLRGLLSFRTPSHIVGVLLNDCTPALCKSLAPMLEAETGLPVLGCLPHMEAAVLPSRHLGLCTAEEIGDLPRRLETLAAGLEESADLPRLLHLCQRENTAGGFLKPVASQDTSSPRIAVARDSAFCFLYPETLDTLTDAGAELVFFSPLEDTALPANTAGLYLPGGYPELYAKALSQNREMREAVRQAVISVLPTVAECGGFLYLGNSLEEAGTGRALPMVGALPGVGFATGRLVRFGYAQLSAKEDGLLLHAGETVPVHEFHHWDSTQNGAALRAEKPVSGRSWDCGFVGPSLYAAFPHLYFAGRPELARRFVAAAAKYAAGPVFGRS